MKYRRLLGFLNVLGFMNVCSAANDNSIFLEQSIFGSNQQSLSTGIGYMLNTPKFHLRSSIGITSDRTNWKISDTDSSFYQKTNQMFATISPGIQLKLRNNTSLCFSGDISGEIDFESVHDMYMDSRKNNRNIVFSFTGIIYRNLNDKIYLGAKITPFSYRILNGDSSYKASRMN